MSSKTEEYLALAQRTANGLTRYWESWTDYLTTASRLYKYSFPDQLMIYAQRPDATACADFDIWNNRIPLKTRDIAYSGLMIALFLSICFAFHTNTRVVQTWRRWLGLRKRTAL